VPDVSQSLFCGNSVGGDSFSGTSDTLVSERFVGVLKMVNAAEPDQIAKKWLWDLFPDRGELPHAVWAAATFA